MATEALPFSPMLNELLEIHQANHDRNIRSALAMELSFRKLDQNSVQADLNNRQWTFKETQLVKKVEEEG